jgi:hypothetical protein
MLQHPDATARGCEDEGAMLRRSEHAVRAPSAGIAPHLREITQSSDKTWPGTRRNLRVLGQAMGFNRPAFHRPECARLGGTSTSGARPLVANLPHPQKMETQLAFVDRDCRGALDLAENYKRLRTVPLQMLIHSGASLTRALTLAERSDNPRQTGFDPFPRLMSARKVVLAEIERRKCNPPPQGAFWWRKAAPRPPR